MTVAHNLNIQKGKEKEYNENANVPQLALGNNI